MKVLKTTFHCKLTESKLLLSIAVKAFRLCFYLFFYNLRRHLLKESIQDRVVKIVKLYVKSKIS